MALRPKLIGLFTCLALLSFTAQAQNWDVDLLDRINPSDPSSNYWEITSSSAYWVPASGILSTYIAGHVKKNRSLRQESYKALVSIAVSTAASQLAKLAFNRTRPSYAYPGKITEGGYRRGVSKYSFPSGHTCLAFTYATTLSMQYKKWYVTVPAFVWASSVGYSRMYLGKHYPSDVIGGAAIGVASALLTRKLNKKLFHP